MYNVALRTETANYRSLLLFLLLLLLLNVIEIWNVTFSHKIKWVLKVENQYRELNLIMCHYLYLWWPLDDSQVNEVIEYRCTCSVPVNFLISSFSTFNEFEFSPDFAYIIMRLIWFVHKKLGLLSWEYRDVFYMHQLQKWIKQVAIYLHYLQSTFENCWI